MTCTACDVVVDDLGFRLDEVRTCPACGAGATRPGVVLFGESLPIEAFRASMEAAASVQLVLLVGTSGVVQPAASIPVVAKQSGAVLVEVNPEPTALSSLCDHHLRGPAGSVLDALLDAAEFP